MLVVWFLNGIKREPRVLIDRVRNSVKSVLPCNVFFGRPLSAAGPSETLVATVESRYDVIISTLCLEFAAVDLEEYRAAVDNVTSLLLPSGYLILQVTRVGMFTNMLLIRPGSKSLFWKITFFTLQVIKLN